MPPRYWPALIAISLAAACASPQPLHVTSYVVRDLNPIDHNADPMARNEKLRRLHGAVSIEERRQLLGHYYTFNWHHPDGKGSAPATLTFEYQQGATASQIKSIRREFPADNASGTTEISIIGDDYIHGGRVLAWRATLRRGDETIATRQSYLWQ